MRAYGIVIEPDGEVLAIESPDVASVALDRFSPDGSTVLTLIGPHALHLTDEPDALFVGWVAEWGRVNRLPLNIDAWALYGRSPICGPMLVALDGVPGGQRDPLPPSFVDALMSSREWVPAELKATMRALLEQEAAAGGELWVPEWNGVD